MPDDTRAPGELVLDCPAPIMQREHIELAHGSGGVLMHQLIERVFAAGLADPALDTKRDAAVVNLAAGQNRLAFTTDSYVVKPLFFPGGDIGALAINGTVNDLATSGARPLCLSTAMILEEGLPVATLERIVASMRAAAERAGVHIVTGDTKVVDRGSGDGIFINTAGLGVIAPNIHIGPEYIRPGDVVLVSSDVGRHGMAIASVRQGLAFDTRIESDCAPLADLVHTLLDQGVDIHCLRDLTRGGLATAMVEIATAARVDIELCEPDIPVAGNVHAACELLGLDPLYVANEGCMAVFVPEAQAGPALDIMRAHPQGVRAARAGTVAGHDSSNHTSQGSQTGSRAGRVTLQTALGTRRVLAMLSGEQLPRIC